MLYASFNNDTYLVGLNCLHSSVKVFDFAVLQYVMISPMQSSHQSVESISASWESQRLRGHFRAFNELVLHQPYARKTPSSAHLRNIYGIQTIKKLRLERSVWLYGHDLG